MEKLEISYVMIEHLNHDLKFKSFSQSQSFRTGISGVVECQRCHCQGHIYTDLSGPCFWPEIKYIYRPVYKYENVALCSVSLIKKGIQYTADEMIKFLKKWKNFNIPLALISGYTSVASQAFSKIRNENLIEEYFYIDKFGCQISAVKLKKK